MCELIESTLRVEHRTISRAPTDRRLGHLGIVVTVLSHQIKTTIIRALMVSFLISLEEVLFWARVNVTMRRWLASATPAQSAAYVCTANLLHGHINLFSNP